MSYADPDGGESCSVARGWRCGAVGVRWWSRSGRNIYTVVGGRRVGAVWQKFETVYVSAWSGYGGVGYRADLAA